MYESLISIQRCSTVLLGSGQRLKISCKIGARKTYSLFSGCWWFSSSIVCFTHYTSSCPSSASFSFSFAILQLPLYIFILFPLSIPFITLTFAYFLIFKHVFLVFWFSFLRSFAHLYAASSHIFLLLLHFVLHFFFSYFRFHCSIPDFLPLQVPHSCFWNKLWNFCRVQNCPFFQCRIARPWCQGMTRNNYLIQVLNGIRRWNWGATGLL